MGKRLFALLGELLNDPAAGSNSRSRAPAAFCHVLLKAYAELGISLHWLRAEDGGAGRKGISVTDFYFSDERWALIAPHLPGKESDPGCHARDNRLFIEAVFWILRNQSSWRRLPPHFGKWYTNYTRFRRWTRKGVWPGVLAALAAGGPSEYFCEDGEIFFAPLCPLATQEAGTAPREAQGGCDGDASAPLQSRSQQNSARLLS